MLLRIMKTNPRKNLRSVVPGVSLSSARRPLHATMPSLRCALVSSALGSSQCRAAYRPLLLLAALFFDGAGLSIPMSRQLRRKGRLLAVMMWIARGALASGRQSLPLFTPCAGSRSQGTDRASCRRIVIPASGLGLHLLSRPCLPACLPPATSPHTQGVPVGEVVWIFRGSLRTVATG